MILIQTSYKQGGFFKTLSKKGLEFIPYRKNGKITFKLRFILLPIVVNSISKKQGDKKDAFLALDSDFVKIVSTLLTKIITLYV